jgi:hypothetical protein
VHRLPQREHVLGSELRDGCGAVWDEQSVQIVTRAPSDVGSGAADDDEDADDHCRTNDHRRPDDNEAADDHRRTHDHRRPDDDEAADDHRRTHDHRRPDDNDAAHDHRRTNDHRRPDDDEAADDHRRTHDDEGTIELSLRDVIRPDVYSGRGLLRCGRTGAAVHPEELGRQMLHALQRHGRVRGFPDMLRRVRAGGKQLGLLLRLGLDVLPCGIADAGRHVLPGWQDMLRGHEHRCVLRVESGVRRELEPLRGGVIHGARDGVTDARP